jgi:hypothetical protein
MAEQSRGLTLQFNGYLLLSDPNEYIKSLITAENNEALANLTLNSLWKGDYIMGVGDVNTIGLAAVNQNSPQMKVYPNPAKEDFTIEFDSEKEDKVSIRIFSLNGNEEKNIEVKSEKGANRIRTTTNGLVPGHYIVKVIRSGEVLTSKMIISN